MPPGLGAWQARQRAIVVVLAGRHWYMIFVIRLTARAWDGISALPERWTEESRATRGLFFAYCSATAVTVRLALLFLPGLLRADRLCILLDLLLLLALLAVLLPVAAHCVAISLAVLGGLLDSGRGVGAVGLALRRIVVHVLLHRSDLLHATMGVGRLRSCMKAGD